MARSFGGFENRFKGVGVGFSPESRNFRHRVHDGRLAAQLVEQRLGVLQVGSVEPFGEPAVDFG
jgi:hypothetical protein